MELFIDTANLDDIKEVMSWGIISGCTTNPAIVAKEEGCDFETRMKEILSLVKGPVSIEVTTNDPKEMVTEAEKYSKWGNNVVIKIPMGVEGLKATSILANKGIKTNVTACMSASQAMLAAKAGATYVSLFFGRISDMGYNAYDVVKQSVEMFKQNEFKSKIIIGSIRSVSDIMSATMAGAHVITIPPKFFPKMANHPKTTETIDEFLKFWAEFKKTKK